VYALFSTCLSTFVFYFVLFHIHNHLFQGPNIFFEKKENTPNLPRFGRDHVAHGSSGLKPLRLRTPVGGHYFLGASFLGSLGDLIVGAY